MPFLRQQVSAYVQGAADESWKQLHEEAMACRDLEVLLQVGIGLFRSILKYLPETGKGIDSEVLDLVQWWVRPCENLDAHIRQIGRAHV